MSRLIIMLVVIALIFACISYLLHRFIKTRFVKYIPSALALGGALYQFILSRTGQNSGFEDIARLLMAIMFFTGFIASQITLLILDFTPSKEDI